MKRRIAYIGLSYPLLYDYQHQAEMTENDVADSPNPIIESPLGLMILYDELWFLCESICIIIAPFVFVINYKKNYIIYKTLTV